MPDGLIVRPADAEDDKAIDRVIRAAFSGTEFGHQGEAELVRMIDTDGDALVSLVAERDGVIVGHEGLFGRGASLGVCGAIAPATPVRQGLYRPSGRNLAWDRRCS